MEIYFRERKKIIYKQKKLERYTEMKFTEFKLRGAKKE